MFVPCSFDAICSPHGFTAVTMDSNGDPAIEKKVFIDTFPATPTELTSLLLIHMLMFQTKHYFYVCYRLIIAPEFCRRQCI